MKKEFKLLVTTLIVLIMALIVLVILSGGNKLIATKITENEINGISKEKHVIKLKDNKIKEVEINIQYDNEKQAEAMYNMFHFFTTINEEDKMDGIELKRDGKKIEMGMDAEAYVTFMELSDKEIIKEALKKSLEGKGYKVK